MKTYILLLVLAFYSIESNCQNKIIDERPVSYSLARSFYVNKDYFNAYKYLMIFKYSNFDKLSSAENKDMVKKIDDCLSYCEQSILGASKTTKSTFKGHSFEDSSSSSKQKEIPAKHSANSSPPLLPVQIKLL